MAAENVFRHCELLGIRRLAMPALGIGAAQFGADHSARLIVEALAKHSLNPTIIEKVIFCLPDPKALQAFSLFLQPPASDQIAGSSMSMGRTVPPSAKYR
jgi:O-acetyl-ADP-ribose deacetylase (regulator of RNase III)